nr:immunoglobulin heavy chain junction region [Macaca mulatta]
CASDSGYFEFW